MNAELSALMDAAEQWRDMAGEFATQEGDYLSEVHAVAAGAGQPGSWTGVAAQEAGSAFDVTLAEYRAARKEALAVCSLLQDAYAQFAGLRKRLETVRAEAVAAGLRISGRGVVTVDTEARPPAPGETCGSAEEWQRRIDAAVRAVDDADAGVALALRAATRDGRRDDGTAGGFNAEALHDVEGYEARAGGELARRMADGATLGAAEVDELRRLFRDNQHDANFSRMFLSGLGAEGLLTIGSRANDLVHTVGGEQARGMADIASGLSRTLASATRDTGSPWYEGWRAEMREAGIRQYGSQFAADHMAAERGYQSLVTLMGQGGEFGSPYLADLGDDLIAAERKDPDLWDMVGPVDGKDGWFANDPVDGVLGLMSRDPEGAAAYLQHEERMKYLAAERDWRSTLLESSGGPLPDHDTDHIDRDGYAGFAAALEAATTGVTPGEEAASFVEHTEANDRAFQFAVKHLATSEDDFPHQLREPMGRILANHGATVHEVASAFGPHSTPIAQDALFEVAKQTSRDAHGYAALNVGMNTPIVTALHEVTHESPEGSLILSGRTIGFLEEARNQALTMDSAVPDEPDWVQYAKMIAGHLPIVSGEAQLAVENSTESWVEDEKKRYHNQVSGRYADEYLDRSRQLSAFADTWWRVHGSGGATPPDVYSSITTATDGGRNHCKGFTGVPR
ncbi:DUF6571 family protein [Streptomyces sp. NPDC047130]|uniref:DUF6571 family protein n=1 Tax=Streptomyces sp. NPDC047130 TaxID=3155261 RepID=UPI00340C5BA8